MSVETERPQTLEQMEGGARPNEPPAPGPIVVGVDGTAGGDDAVALARLLALALGKRLLLAHAVTPVAIGRGGAAYEASARAEATRILATTAADLGPSVADRRIVDERGVALGLLDVLGETRASMLVLGSSHRGAIGRVLAGSIAEDMLGRAHCPIVVAPHGYRSIEAPIRVVGVAYDATPAADRALDFGLSVARATGAAVRLWSVIAPTRAEGHRQLGCELDRLPEGVRATATVLEGRHAAKALAAAAAQDGADLVVVAGWRGFDPMSLLGGAARGLLRSTPTAIAVVPQRRPRPAR